MNIPAIHLARKNRKYGLMKKRRGSYTACALKNLLKVLEFEVLF